MNLRLTFTFVLPAAVGVACGLAALEAISTGCGAGTPSSGDAGIDAGFRADVISTADGGGDDVLAADDSGPPDVIQAGTEPDCTSTDPSLAPVLDGSGSWQCVAVGASREPMRGIYEDTAGLPGPYAYVHAGSTDPMADGTMPHPYATIDAALAGMPAVRTILLASDVTHVAPSAPFTRSIAIVGPRARYTAIRASANGGTDASPAYALVAQGLGTDVLLQGVAIDGTDLTDHAAAGGVRATTSASVTLRDVVVHSVGRGVQAESGSTVHADGVSIDAPGAVGFFFDGGSDGDLKSIDVANPTGPCVYASDSHVNITLGHVHDCAGGGVLINGGVAGTVDRLDRLTARHNALAGVFITGASADADLESVLAAGNHASATAMPPGGFGLLASSGAHVVTDTAIHDDSARGHGSWFAFNDAAGVVADGVGGGSPTDVELDGVTARRNGTVGAIYQDGASAHVVSYSWFAYNVGAGLVAAGNSRVGWMLCDGFIANTSGLLMFEHGSETLGDGLVVAYTGSGSTNVLVQGGLFSDNQRYGAFFVGATVSLQGNMGLDPAGQQVAQGPGAMVMGYEAPVTDVHAGSIPMGAESFAVPSITAP